MLIAIPLYSSTSTFCPIGKFCKVTTFSGIMQGKFLVCRTTDNRLRTTDFWAVADGFKTTSQRLYKTTSRAVADCFKTTSQRVNKTTSKVVADGFKTTSQRVNRTTSKVVAVLTFDFRLLSDEAVP